MTSNPNSLFNPLPTFPKLLLASKSPRRHQLLRDSGFDFELVEIDADENYAGIQIEIIMETDDLILQDVANYYIRFLKSDFSPDVSLERVIENMNDE